MSTGHHSLLWLPPSHLIIRSPLCKCWQTYAITTTFILFQEHVSAKRKKTSICVTPRTSLSRVNKSFRPSSQAGWKGGKRNYLKQYLLVKYTAEMQPAAVCLQKVYIPLTKPALDIPHYWEVWLVRIDAWYFLHKLSKRNPCALSLYAENI